MGKTPKIFNKLLKKMKIRNHFFFLILVIHFFFTTQQIGQKKNILEPSRHFSCFLMKSQLNSKEANFPYKRAIKCFQKNCINLSVHRSLKVSCDPWNPCCLPAFYCPSFIKLSLVSLHVLFPLSHKHHIFAICFKATKQNFDSQQIKSCLFYWFWTLSSHVCRKDIKKKISAVSI